MFRKRLFLPLLLAILVSLACNLPAAIRSGTSTPNPTPIVLETLQPPTPENLPTPESTISGDSCVLGIWQLENIDQFAESILPKDIPEVAEARFKETRGSIQYTFNPDNRFSVTAQKFELHYDVPYLFFTVPLVITLDGTTTGEYKAENNVITSNHILSDNLGYTATIAGAQVTTPGRVSDYAPVFKPPFNSTEYTCDNSSLSLKFEGEGNQDQSLEFRRLSQE